LQEDNMQAHMLISARIVAALIAITLPTQFAAQDDAAQVKKAQHHHYKLIDMGTFGGPASYFSNGFDGILNNRGTAAGWADTSTPDPYPPFCFNPDCFESHTFQSQNGVVTDLGVLPGGASSTASWITANGLIVGTSQNGQIDPLFSGFPEGHAVIWRDGAITDLGILPEGGYESIGISANNSGKVVGFALNTIPDPYSLAAPGFFPTQTRAFLWQMGTMQDLGTLGGNDAAAYLVNDRGQIAGQSYTNTTPNQTTGLPTADPFFWEKNEIRDIGSLGGTLGSPSGFNNRGQVIGTSNLAGDLTSHPFLWSKKTGLQDLGTLGGNNGVTNWINDAGDIAGKVDLPGPLPQNHDAVLWRKNGAEMIDLGVLPGDSCANAYYVNSRGQVVGTSENSDLCRIPTGEHAFLWEDSGPMVDLNTVIPSGSSLDLTFAVAINDRGEIAGFGVPAGCAPQDVGLCGHAYVLIPCDDDHANVEGCDYSMVDASVAATQVSPAAEEPSFTSPNQVAPAFGAAANPMMRRFGHRFGPWYRGMGPETPALRPTSAPPTEETTRAPNEVASEQSSSCSQGSDGQSVAKQAKSLIADNRLDEPFFRKEQAPVCGAKYPCSSHFYGCRFCSWCIAGFVLNCSDLQYHRRCFIKTCRPPDGDNVQLEPGSKP
jgi:probable HAF family extracellular repeat protein